MGKHRTSFSELVAYYEAHPAFRGISDSHITGLPYLKSEYSDLSKAVHGSGASFMVGDQNNMPNVYLPNATNLGQWSTRQKKTVEGLNLFMLTFHREKLFGTAYPAMRKALAGLFVGGVRAKIKAGFKVTLSI
jgi:hypothetical protein